MKITKEDFITKLKELFGEEVTDEQLELLEDVEDSWNETDGESVEEVEKKWRKKYYDRFGSKTKEEDGDGEEEEEEKKTKFDDLFKKGVE